MPSVESTGRHQKAVLWAASGHDRHGRIEVSAAVELDVRWEEGRRESTGEDGTPIACDATVWVNQVIALESIMWKGALADVPSSTSDLFQVVSREDVPDVKGRNTQRTVLLRKYADALPEIV